MFTVKNHVLYIFYIVVAIFTMFGYSEFTSKQGKSTTQYIINKFVIKLTYSFVIYILCFVNINTFIMYPFNSLFHFDNKVFEFFMLKIVIEKITPLSND